MAKKKPAPISVDAHKHVADKRPNIPTRETAAFAADDGIGKAVYHRDRSLDPQLVWKGKDDQDAKPLAVAPDWIAGGAGQQPVFRILVARPRAWPSLYGQSPLSTHLRAIPTSRPATACALPAGV